MAVEVASAYVSLSVSTAQIPRQINSAFSGASAAGEKAGKDAGNSMASSFGTNFKKGAAGLAGAFGVGLGIAGVAEGFKQVISVGNDFTTSLNTMSAVSGATAAQLEAVSQRSRELGNDISLPGTSAGDAAAAMTELAKGGFSVEQSMAAAKGTLQLAAAAQIDAATAATIQSQALQAFGLNADYAAKTSDVLANAANASSAEITDIAAGMQQAGAVANQFGLSLEDTATGLALFANAGITGSDAGTLIKSALLALTDTSKPAQGAIETLGLTVYDAQGAFVGLSSLFGQLDEAAASMSDEQYQAATATLFGSDAMRLAGVAAQVGSAGFDQMEVAINRQGAAAEVAAAKTQGLPGALAAVSNSAETVALSIYDLVKGPLQEFANTAADAINDNGPKIVSTFKEIGSAAGTVGGFIGDAVGAFRELPGPIQAAAVALAAIKFTGFDDKIGGIVSGLKEQFAGFREEMELQQELAASSSAEYDGLGEAIEGNAEPLSEVAAGLATLEARSPAVRAMGDAYRGVTARTNAFAERQRAAATATGGVTAALRNATAAAARFGGVAAGAAAAGMRGLALAARTAVNAFGGPWLLAITAVTTAISGFRDAAGRQDAQQTALADSAQKAAASQTELAKAFQASSGSINDQVMGAVVQQVEGLNEELTSVAETAPGAFDFFLAGGKDVAGWFSGVAEAGTDAFNAQEDTAQSAQDMKAAMDALGLSSEDVAQKLVSSNVEFETFRNVLINSGEKGAVPLANRLTALRDNIEITQRSAATLQPGFLDLADSIRIIADASSSAEDKTSALKRALDVLAGGTVPLSEAVANYEQTIADVAESTADAVDQTQGFGDALLDGGKLNLATQNGRDLQDTLMGIKDATAEAVFAGADADQLFAKNSTTFANLATQYGVGVTEIEAFAAALGYVPENITTLVGVQGADQATQEMQAVALAFQTNIPGDLSVEVLVDDDLARSNLEDLGFAVKQVPGSKNVEVTAPNALALAALQQVIDKTVQTGAAEATPKIDADTTSFFLKEGAARAALAQVDASSASPEIRAIIDNLLQGKEVSLAALAQIDTTNANPDVILAITQALQDAQTVNDAIDRAARDRKSVLTIETRADALARQNLPSSFIGPVIQQPKAEGGSIVGGVPGVDSVPILAMPGEHMLTVDDVNRLGGQAGVYRFRQMLQSGMVEKFADGGAIGGGVVGAMRSIVQKRWPMMELTSGQRDEPGSYHNTGQAADFSNGGDAGTPEMNDLAYFIADNYLSSTAELIHSPFDSNIKDGADVGDGMSVYGADTMSQHRNHVHWAMTTAPSEPVEQTTEETAAPLSAKDGYVDAIVAEGRRRGITDKGITIALATMLAESDGIMYANNAVPDSLNLPHEAVGSDTDSVGLFQQRDNGAWGSLEDRMDPARSAGMFYEEIAKLDYENMDPAAAAQAVQRSAFADGSNYAARVGEAEGLLAAANARSLNPVKTVTVDPVEVAEVAQAEAEKPKDPNAAPAPSAQQPSAPPTFNLQERGRKYVTDVAGILYDAALEQLPFGLGQSRLLSLPIPDLTPQPVTVPAGTQPQEPKQWVPEMLETGNFPGVASAGVQEDSPVVDFILKLREAIPQIPVFDSGGWVRPGLNLINNKTGGPELLRNVTKQQSLLEPKADISAEALRPIQETHFHVSSVEEAFRRNRLEQQKAAIAYGGR